jgi:glyceraldehyde 3-phosphate dehydrogenase
MTIKIGINGFGRIGRNVLRAIYENNFREDLQVVAINDLGDIENSVYLIKFDTAHGKFKADIKVEKDFFSINGDKIVNFAERDPSLIPWGRENVDIVFECTGRFTNKDKAELHLKGGAKKVMISAPGKNVDKTIVFGVNHSILTSSDTIISNASCTTNCLAPIAKIIHDEIGIISGMMNTIHAYTNDQALVDSDHEDYRRGRSAAMSMIPTKTGAASSIGLVVPELAGKLDGLAIRVPVVNVSLLDLSFISNKPTTIDAINQIMTKASQNAYKGILEINTQPLVSCDFNHNPASAIFDATQTKVVANSVKVLAWYDNEWGFSNRMLDVAKYWARLT